MVQNNKTETQLWKLYNSLKGTAGYYNLFSNTVYLIFLKYIISYGDKLEKLGIESFKAISAFKRKYDNARTNGDPLNASDISELFRTLDSENVFENVRLTDCLQDYYDLFRYPENQRSLIRIIEEFDIEFTNEYLINFFELLIQQSARDVKSTGESSTTKALRKICTKLLDIKENDVVLNCFAGFSTLMFDIKVPVYYVGYEINIQSFILSKMILTLLGTKNYQLFNDDFFLANTHNFANKVFCDGPLGIRYDDRSVSEQPWFKDKNTKDGNLLILYKAIDSVKEGGKAVIAVPGRVLFSNHPSYEELRKTYIENGLRAVIALPPLWSGVSINTNLLVVEKGYKGKIEFINALEQGVVDRQKRFVLLDDNIEQICMAINDLKSIDGYCKAVDRQEVLDNSSWEPYRYINVASNIKIRSIKEIYSELDNLYEEFSNNLK